MGDLHRKMLLNEKFITISGSGKSPGQPRTGRAPHGGVPSYQPIHVCSNISTITLFTFHTMENGIHAIDIRTLQLHHDPSHFVLGKTIQGSQR